MLGLVMTKRRPAFSKQFQPRPYPKTNRLLLGWSGFLFASEAVKNGRRDVLALHPDSSPHEVDWTLLRGLSVLIVEHEDIGHEYRHQLIDALALAGARDGYLIPASKCPDDACAFNVSIGRAAT